MARALCTHAFHFPVAERDQVLAGLQARREGLKAHGVKYWVFENPSTPGIMIEFFEASGREELTEARRAVGDTRASDAILSEVEF